MVADSLVALPSTFARPQVWHYVTAPSSPHHNRYNTYFVDLFVRCSNTVAIRMYASLNYSVYRRVLGYYSGTEDAFDMRRALPRDKTSASVVPLPRPITVDELMAWKLE